MASLEELLPEALTGHPLLDQALTHVSAGSGHNERLEFLGDAVIGQAVAHWLYSARPDEDEGGLSRLRSTLVSRAGLSRAARDLGLGERLRLSGKAAERGEAANDRILAGTIEALVGAVFLVCGGSAAVTFIERLLGDAFARLPEHSRDARDAKTQLQEHLQARHRPLPSYRVARQPGGARQDYLVICVVGRVVGTGRGATRRAAELAAAADALEQMHNTGSSGLHAADAVMGSA